MKITWLPILGACLLGSGCAEEDSDHPPVLSPPALSNPVVCDRLADTVDPPAVTAAGTFLIDGEEAECLAQGQQCILAWASGHCDAQVPVAECRESVWRLSCWGSPSDAGATDSLDPQDSAMDVVFGEDALLDSETEAEADGT